MNDLEARLLQKLSETGYVLEMRVAAVARRRVPEFRYVEQGRQYVDASSGVVREADVLVCDAWRGALGDVFHYAVVECKGSPHPWVAFTDRKPQTHVAEASAEKRLERLKTTLSRVEGDAVSLGERVEGELFPGPSLFDEGVVAYSVAQPLDKAGKDHAWNGVRQALAAASGFIGDVDPSLPSPYALMVTPVVVTTAPLFASWLDEDNEPAIESVSGFEMLVRRDLDSTVRVHVVSEEAWLAWLDRFRSTTMGLLGPVAAT